MERKEIIAAGAVVAVAVAATVGFILYRSNKETNAIREEGKARVDQIYADMDRAMAEHVKEMARLEAERANNTERHNEVMEALAVAREQGENLHLEHLEILSDLANKTITAKEAADRIRALNVKDVALAA
jgi:hypothetical protein